MLMPQVDKSSYIAPLPSFLLLPFQFFLHFFPPSTLTWEENRSNGLIYFSICIENKGQPWMVLWSRLGKKGRQKGKERRETKWETSQNREILISPPSPSLSLSYFLILFLSVLLLILPDLKHCRSSAPKEKASDSQEEKERWKTVQSWMKSEKRETFKPFDILTSFQSTRRGKIVHLKYVVG